jgi:chromosome segregation ATPase
MAKDAPAEKAPNDGPSQEDFDKMKAALEKANAEAMKYRLDVKAKDDELSKLQEAQDSSKSEMDKVREQIESLESRAEKAEREALVAQVAQAKKLPAALAGRLTGSSREELEADADSLIEALNLGDGKKPTEKPNPKGGGRPKESLTPGASNEDDDNTEITAEEAEKIAEKVMSTRTI